MDDWEKFNETSLPEKDGFCNKLNMEDIIDADHMHGRRVCKEFKIKKLGEYHDLYVQSDTLVVYIFCFLCFLKYACFYNYFLYLFIKKV